MRDKRGRDAGAKKRRGIMSGARWMDITQPLYTGMGVWPGDEGMVHEALSDMRRGDANNISRLSMGVHTGTHVDAPFHFVADGKRLGEMDMNLLLGEAYVLDASGAEGAHISRRDMEGRIPDGALRLLLRTRNARFGYPAAFREDFTAMREDAVAYAYERGVRLLGIDALSVAPMGALSTPVHVAFLQHDDVMILEGIDLRDVAEGWYDLACLPLRLDDAGGAPARAMLRKREEKP